MHSKRSNSNNDTLKTKDKFLKENQNFKQKTKFKENY